VSHHAAAAVYRLRQFPEGVLSVTVPHPQHQRVAGATVHQSRVLERHHWINLYGRRTTTLARTLVDLAAVVSHRDLDLAYEDAILTEHLTHARMSRCFLELMHDGRRGMAKLGSILDERGPGFVAAASELERMLFRSCTIAGLTPVRQYAHPGREIVDGCVDGAFVEAKLIVEADGRRWHNRLAAQRHDRARDKAAARAGWQTLRFCHEELTEDVRGQAEAIRETYDKRCRLLAPSA
jgi:very-short-patch-repair endonuclease